MADIDLKTLTPDTSLPTTGFLFGADSQATASPSVYSTQTVATTLLGSTTLTGATLTADAPVLNLAQTWNNVAITFTGMKFNVASDTSAAASLLMDLQVGAVSKFNVTKTGAAYGTLIGSTTATFGISATTGIGFFSSNRVSVLADGQVAMFFGSNQNVVANGRSLSFESAASGAGDTFITRKNTRIIQLGAADAATALAQTLSVQSVVAGTSNTAGAAFTVTGSQGTGTGAGGSLIFQVAPAGTAGTAQNALADTLTLGSSEMKIGIGGSPLITLGHSSASTSARIGFFSGVQLMNSTLGGVATLRVTNGSLNDVGGIQFGGTTSAFPALKRSTTSLQARLADDSAFTNIQGKLTTDTAYTAGALVATGYITIYDSTGTAYRVPCLV